MRRIKKALASCSGGFDKFLQSVDSQEDADRLLSYYTRQQVLFLDAKLGATAYLIQFSIAVFIVGYIFIYKKGYLELEQAKGAAVTHVFGDAVSVSSGHPATRYFGIEELTYPGLENGNLFVATRQSIHRQMRGLCEDPDVPCMSDADCTPLGKGTCTEMGLCLEHSWCSVEKEAEIYEMESDKIQVWVRSFIQYVKLAPGKVFQTSTAPNAGNTFTIRQLLMMCDPIPVNYEEVAELGAVFEVAFRWDCNTKWDPAKHQCKPEINVRRIDTILDPDNIGFGFKYGEYVDSDHRVQNEVRGLRFFFRTSGVGKQMSVAATITTASTSAALLSFAIIFADLLLTKVFANKKKYCARKFEVTPDFSEYIQELETKKACAVTVEAVDKAEQAVRDKEDEWLMKFAEES